MRDSWICIAIGLIFVIVGSSFEQLAVLVSFGTLFVGLGIGIGTTELSKGPKNIDTKKSKEEEL